MKAAALGGTTKKASMNEALQLLSSCSLCWSPAGVRSGEDLNRALLHTDTYWSSTQASAAQQNNTTSRASTIATCILAKMACWQHPQVRPVICKKIVHATTERKMTWRCTSQSLCLRDLGTTTRGCAQKSKHYLLQIWWMTPNHGLRHSFPCHFSTCLATALPKEQLYVWEPLIFDLSPVQVLIARPFESYCTKPFLSVFTPIMTRSEDKLEGRGRVSDCRSASDQSCNGFSVSWLYAPWYTNVLEAPIADSTDFSGSSLGMQLPSGCSSTGWQRQKYENAIVKAVTTILDEKEGEPGLRNTKHFNLIQLNKLCVKVCNMISISSWQPWTIITCECKVTTCHLWQHLAWPEQPKPAYISQLKPIRTIVLRIHKL